MFRSFRFSSKIAVLAVAGLSLALVSGCKNKGGSKVPRGMNQKQVEQQRDEVKESARLAGLLDLARADLAKGRYMSAMRRGEEALAKDDKNADAHVVIAAAHWRAGRLDESTEAFRKALALDAKNYPAIIGLGRNLQAVAKHDEALTLLDGLIANEGKGFKETKCDEEGQCSDGWCDTATKMCRAHHLMGPRLVKLWSQYLLLDVKGGLQTSDEIFLGGAGDEGDQDQLPIAQAYAGFLRAFEGTELLGMEGEEGKALLALDVNQGIKHTLAEVGGKEVDVVLSELQAESRVSPDLAKRLKLKELAKIKPIGSAGGEDQVVVLLPAVKIGDLTIKNVPALVQDLSGLTLAEEPQVVLGRQVLTRLGSVSFDYGNRSLVVRKNKPDKLEGGSSVPLAFLDMRVLAVPAAQVGLDGSKHRFWAWFGGVYGSGLALSQKHYIKSDHRPADLAEVEYPDQGLDSVFIRSVDLGTLEIPGVGAYVFMNTPPEAVLQQVVDNTGFELGGYLNVTLLQHYVVTYVLQDGVVHLAPKG